MRRAVCGWVAVGLLGLPVAACSSDNTTDTQSKTSTTSTTMVARPATMQLTSSAFRDNGTIPIRYTCAGEGAVPDLFWSAPPAGTDQLALLVFDPDAGADGFVHFLRWDLPARARTSQSGPGLGAMPGMNSAGSERWIPPCPPSGSPHHYQFTVFALDHEPQIAPTANVNQFLAGIQGSVIGEGRLTGVFGR